MTQNKSNRIELYVSTLLEDLKGGLSWYKKDDQGFGSVQEKYDASDSEVTAIKNHPALKNVEPTFRVFVVIDDTKEVIKPERKREEVPVAEQEQLFAVEPVVAQVVEQETDYEHTPEAGVEEFLSL